MDPQIERVTRDLLEHAFLYDDPYSFREGVMRTARALDDLAPGASGEPGDLQLAGPGSCPECLIPYDEVDPDDSHCPWCGARNPEPLQSLMWAELKAMELAWPEALGA